MVIQRISCMKNLKSTILLKDSLCFDLFVVNISVTPADFTWAATTRATSAITKTHNFLQSKYFSKHFLE